VKTLNLDELSNQLTDFVKEKYSNDVGDIPLIIDIYKILIETIRGRKESIYYSVLASRIGLISSVDAFEIDLQTQLAHLIGIVSHFEKENGRPMLSAIVVNKESKMPGGGFFGWAKQLELQKKESNREFWINQIKELRKCWKLESEI
jgi:hypothetical protein